MPIWEGSGDGDLFVEYNVVLPVELSMGMRRSKSYSVQSSILMDTYRRRMFRAHGGVLPWVVGTSW